jgi:CheY-like chemotaxis protein
VIAERKILVVDDEETICQVVSACLEDWPGTKVVCANNGNLAAERLRGDRYDLALIDALLPGPGGFELAEIAANQNVAVLMLSGHPEITAKLRAVSFPHISKPFRLSELLKESRQVIASSLENSRRVQTALALLKTRAEALQTAIEESRRILGESMEQSARAEGRALK